jgi:hypothetical protein
MDLFSDDYIEDSLNDSVINAPPSLPTITIISYCEACKHTNMIRSPFIMTPDQMRQRGWKEMKKDVWAVGGTCCRQCEIKKNGK